MADLHIPIKGIYFDQIKSGEKLIEYRLRIPYWIKRLRNRDYDRIVLTRGYPKEGGIEGVTRLTREWRGFNVGTITHPHFGSNAVDVYCIDVSTPAISAQTRHAGTWELHNGGICPVPIHVMVRYRLRMGWESDVASLAGTLRWDHGRTPSSAADVSLRRNDIVAYCIVDDEPLSPSEGGGL